MNGAVPDGGSHQSTSGGSKESTPLVAVATGTVTALTLGVGFSLLALGYPFFWIAFPIGFGGGMPLAVGLAKWYERDAETDSDNTQHRQSDADRALADLRDRYARGELDDEEFETRVERLLETESVADAKSFLERRTRTDEESERPTPDREVEEERT